MDVIDLKTHYSHIELVGQLIDFKGGGDGYSAVVSANIKVNDDVFRLVAFKNHKYACDMLKRHEGDNVKIIGTMRKYRGAHQTIVNTVIVNIDQQLYWEENFDKRIGN